MDKTKIEYRKLTDLVPYENNPRKNDSAVDAVAASIEEFGFLQPIVIDKGDIIVAGHTRHKAAEKLGLKEVPTIKAEDLTEEQIKAYRLADNKTAELADWNFELLDSELAGINEINMEAFGFDQTQVEDPDMAVEDEYDEDAEEIEHRAEYGQIWVLGNHRLMCGDSAKLEDQEKLMGGGTSEISFHGSSIRSSNRRQE